MLARTFLSKARRHGEEINKTEQSEFKYVEHKGGIKKTQRLLKLKIVPPTLEWVYVKNKRHHTIKKIDI